MATVEIAFGSPIDRNGPMDFAYPVASQIITSTASNQVSTAVASAGNQSVTVTSIGGAVRVNIGLSPNATSGTHIRIVGDGQSRAFGGVSAGHAVAIVDV